MASLILYLSSHNRPTITFRHKISGSTVWRQSEAPMRHCGRALPVRTHFSPWQVQEQRAQKLPKKNERIGYRTQQHQLHEKQPLAPLSRKKQKYSLNILT